jgi:hypothetical protein
MSKYFDKNLKWSEKLKSITGLPRPYSEIKDENLKKGFGKTLPIKNNFYLHDIIPIPFNAKPFLENIGAIELIIENDKRCLSEGLCPYCGIKFNPDDECIIWKKYDTIPHLMGDIGRRLFSDHFPFHIECMKQARIFCPYMRTSTNDDEYKKGIYSEKIKESFAYKKFIEEVVWPMIGKENNEK